MCAGIVQLCAGLVPMSSSGFVDWNAVAQIIHISQVAGSQPAAFLDRILKELCCKSFVFSNARSKKVRDTEIHFCYQQSAGGSALIPKHGTSEVLWDTEANLIEVADLILRGGVAGVRSLLIPVRRKRFIPFDAATNEVGGAKFNLLLD